MIYITSDHGGYALKTSLVKHLQKKGCEFKDLGPNELDKEDDYVDYAKSAAKKISLMPSKDQGIFLCRSGQGMCVVANKYPGIRAAVAWNEKVARASKHDDFTNVLCLPSDYISESEAIKIVEAWLNEPWGKESRHRRRIGKIMNIEENFYK